GGGGVGGAWEGPGGHATPHLSGDDGRAASPRRTQADPRRQGEGGAATAPARRDEEGGAMRVRLLAIALVLGAVVALASVYSVSETEQVILTAFGRPVGGVITTPGLHLKLPSTFQVVHRFDKRWLEYEGYANQIPTRDKKYILVDTYARWRIVEPLRFYQAVLDERGGQSRLDDIIDGETRNAVASFDLIEVVRS